MGQRAYKKTSKKETAALKKNYAQTYNEFKTFEGQRYTGMKSSGVPLGMKFKLAHKRFDKEKWSVTEKTQKKHTIKILQNIIRDLKKQIQD